MAIDAIGRVAGSEAAVNQSSQVGIDDFLEIFLTQLNFQDPLEPVDNREFIAQLAQFSSLQIASETNENIEGLLDVSSVNQAVGMLGRDVQYSAAGGSVVGQVFAVRLEGEQLVMDLQTSTGEFVRGVKPSLISLIR